MIFLYSFKSDQEEITFIVFQSLREDDEDDGGGTARKRAELDIAVHFKDDQGQTVVAIHSPYWMVNKTGRLLQYKADDIHRKHPLDYDMPLLFSFKPRYFQKNNKVRTVMSQWVKSLAGVFLRTATSSAEKWGQQRSAKNLTEWPLELYSKRSQS